MDIVSVRLFLICVILHYNGFYSLKIDRSEGTIKHAEEKLKTFLQKRLRLNLFKPSESWKKSKTQFNICKIPHIQRVYWCRAILESEEYGLKVDRQYPADGNCVREDFHFKQIENFRDRFQKQAINMYFCPPTPTTFIPYLLASIGEDTPSIAVFHRLNRINYKLVMDAYVTDLSESDLAKSQELELYALTKEEFRLLEVGRAAEVAAANPDRLKGDDVKGNMGTG